MFAYVTPMKFAENPVFILLLVYNPRLANVSSGFLANYSTASWSKKFITSYPTVRVQHRKAPEFLTYGTQYLTRKMTSKAFVRTTLPRFYAIVLKYCVLVKSLHQPVVRHVRSSIDHGLFDAESATSTVV